MPYFLKSVLLLLLVNSLKSVNAQLKWEVVDERYTLTPNVFTPKGTLYVNIQRDNRGKIEASSSGEITIDLLERVAYITQNNNIFRFKKDDISRIMLDGVGTFTDEEIFKKDFTDSLRINYRRNIYRDLNLNEIEFSSSKRISYDVGDNGFFMKNQKKSLGKICYVSQKAIVLLYENGDLGEFNDGDFNYLQVGTFKAFKCRQLYDYIYEQFVNQLKDNIMVWERNTLNKDIEGLISQFGAIENVTEVSSNLKLFTWKKSMPVYNINIGNATNTFSSTEIDMRGETNTSQTSTLFGFSYSPLFAFGNSYRNSQSVLSTSGSTQVITQSRQSGTVKLVDQGFEISVLVNSSNKALKIFHKNIFSDPRYGEPFRFVSF